VRKLRVLLDTDVLVDAQVRVLFLTAADDELIEYRWTERILSELRRTLVTALGRDERAADRLCDAIRTAFPDSEIREYSDLPTNDPGDDHVLGAAVGGECDLLVTKNRADFPTVEVCEAWDLEIRVPDEALMVVASAIGGPALARVFEQATTVLRTPPVDLAAHLHRLERVAPVSALMIGAELDVPGFHDLLSDYESGARDEDPRRAVSQLVERLREDDLDGCDELLTRSAKSTLGRTQEERGRLLRDIRSRPLAEPDRWGFGSAHRLVGVDREIVKLVRGRADFIVREPTLVEAIVFIVAIDNERWRVDELGIPDPAV
jgi:predicted nucleic acid-binding protein